MLSEKRASNDNQVAPEYVVGEPDEGQKVLFTTLKINIGIKSGKSNPETNVWCKSTQMKVKSTYTSLII